jgi:RNA polymerase sigma-70 factor (ECF subfamily)
MSTPGTELMRAMAAGDRDAFARFYDRYAPLVYPLVLRIVRDRTDAADVLQDVFWEAWRSAGAYDAARGSPEAWIAMRARASAIARARGAHGPAGTFRAADEPATASDGRDVAMTVQGRPFAASALAGLPEAQRQVIDLALYEGLTQTEIAERLEQPAGIVKSRIRHALARLREEMRAT